MDNSTKSGLLWVLVGVVGLFVFFGGGMASGAMMSGGMMGGGMMGGVSWMWFPTLLTLGLGILLGWLLFARK